MYQVTEQTELSAQAPNVADRGLPVGKKLMLHLYRMQAYPADKFSSPGGLTQDGIGIALGISRAHASIELKKLIEKGFVFYNIAHIPHHKRQMYVYSLTNEGYREASDLVSSLEETNIDYTQFFRRDAVFANGSDLNPYFEQAIELLKESIEILSKPRHSTNANLKLYAISKMTSAIEKTIVGFEQILH